MKLPPILASADVPAPRGGGVSASTLAAPYEGIADAGQNVSRSLSRAALVISEAQRAKQDLAIRTEAAAAKASLEVGLAEMDAELHQMERDPDGYLTKYNAGAKSLRESLKKGMKYPEAQAIFEAQGERIVGMGRVGAMKHSNTLFTEGQEATLAATLDAKRTVAGQRAISDDAGFEQDYMDGVAAIGNLQPLLGKKKTVEATIKWRKDLLEERARRHADTDPEGFLASTDRYAQMDADKRDVFVERAKGKVETLRKTAIAEQDKWFDRVEKEAETERKAQLTALEAKALNGALTLDELDDARRMRIVSTREEYAALHTAATKEREAISKPAVLQRFSIAAHSAIPTVTPEAIDKAFIDGDLNRKDWKELKDKVISRLDHLKSEGRTEANQRHSQAEQVLKSGLGITGLLDKYDDQDKQLVDIALREMTARSNAYGGKEDPLAVANELVNRLAPVRQERMRLSVPAIGQTLRFPAADAASAMARLNQERKNLPAAVVAQEERKIADMTRAEGAAADAKIPTAAGKGGASPLRKPGDKPKSGKADE
jgi:hypothetical protein